MMDKHEAQLARAEEAGRILNSEIWTRAFSDVRLNLTTAWESLPTSDTENARDIHRRLKCLNDVRKMLEEHVNTGKLAEKALSMRERVGNTVKSLATRNRTA